ncbi:MAG: sigma-70 family RNA polymerase sigma factor [Pirellulaceae bacterium]
MSAEESERLHDLYAESLLRFLQRITGNIDDAQDCLQLTFMILQQKGGSCLPEARKAWLFRVAHNEARKLFRERDLRQKQMRRHGSDLPMERYDLPLDGVLHRERIAEVRRAMDQLPDDLQTIVRLRIVEGLRFREIADRLQLPLGTALSRMQQALTKLSQKLKE